LGAGARLSKRLIEGAIRAEGWRPLVLLFAVALAAGGTVAEALMLRGLFDVGRELNLSGQRLGAIAALTVFLAA
jgi:hypothetical protein